MIGFRLPIPFLFDGSQKKGNNVTTRALTGTALALLLVACGSSGSSTSNTIDGGKSSIDSAAGSSTDTAAGSIDTAIDSATGSLDTATGSLDTATGSLDTATGSIDSATGSLDTATGSLDTATGSLDTATRSLDTATGSLDTATGSLDTAGTPIGGCPDLSGTYNVTTEIVSTTCPLGLHVITQPITWTFVQAAPSCNFTMTNSLYPASHYAGQFSMVGTQAKVTWTSATPAPIVSGFALTYSAETLTIAPAVPPAAAKLSGSFDWSSAYPCTGTTNVCSGSVASGCLTPN